MARLSYQKRKKMPASAFALPEKKGTKKSGGKSGKGAYPIPDKPHARNALARVSQFGNPSEKKKVRAAVHRKFPDIGRGSEGEMESYARQRSKR